MVRALSLRISPDFLIRPSIIVGVTVIGNLNPLSKIILKDKLGRVVKITHANNIISHKIDISSLANGVYFLSTDNKAIKKIVKQ